MRLEISVEDQCDALESPVAPVLFGAEVRFEHQALTLRQAPRQGQPFSVHRGVPSRLFSVE